MYKYYKAETDYGRTVCRREVEKYWFKNDWLRCFTIIFATIATVCLGSLILAANNIKYSWIVTVSCFGVSLVLALTNYFTTGYKYKKYIIELKQNADQERLKEIYNQQTEKLRNNLEELENMPMGEMTLSNIELRDRIKQDLEY